MAEITSRIQAWADELNADPKWTAALNQTFDAIGFTEDYISRARTSAKCVPLHVKDSIWGMIEVDSSSVVLLNCPLLQRLRSISQLGFAFLTYPTARHSRFEHSLGVYYVVNRLTESFAVTAKAESNRDADVVAVALTDDEARLVRHAALLHDTGHAAFSHASERVFEKYKKLFRVGPFTVEEFKRSMQLHLHELLDPSRKAAERGSRLAEALSVAVVMSNRFAHFYARYVQPCSAGSSRESLGIISALIMGRPPKSKNRALSQIISGAIDADKIDYMTRDARACGISLGVDVSRVFLRAGVYDIRSSDKLADLAVSEEIKETPVKIFVIDQSGTDTLEELGLGRVSMYARVYHHQFSRNIERQYEELLVLVQQSGYDNGRYSDFLQLFSLPEDVVLHTLRSDPAVPAEVRQRAMMLANRELNKRAGCYGITDFRKNSHEILDEKSTGTRAIEREIKETIEKINLQDVASEKTLVQQIISECQEIRKRLLDQRIESEELPREPAPRSLWIIPQPAAKDYLLGRAFVLTSDRTVKQTEARLASYLDAGAIPSQRGYLIADHDWRYIASLAFQQAIYKFDRRTYHVNFTLVGKQTQILGLHRPVLDLSSSAHRCKLRTERLEEIQRRLAMVGYYDASPALVTYKHSEVIKRVQKRFATFESEGGWKVSEHSVKSFLEQFPPRLRDAAVKLLDDIEYLDNKQIAINLCIAIDKIRVPDIKYHLVPFTPSSGELLRTIIRGNYDKNPDVTIYATLIDALSAMEKQRITEKSRHQIIFFDDHIASGTQAKAQLCAWMEDDKKVRNASDSGTNDNIIKFQTDENIFKAPLTKRQKQILLKLPISFAFCVALQDGKKRLQETAAQFHLKLGPHAIQNARDLENTSGKGIVEENLRTFLQEVGHGVYSYNRKSTHPNEDPAARSAKVKKRALGYDDLEGLIVTFMNVPSSTYTALWCPGYYFPRGCDPNDMNNALPWQPLFIRRGALAYSVLG